MTDLFKILKPKQMIAKQAGKLVKQLPGLRDADGHWKRDRDSIALAWQTQFGDIENTEAITVQDLLDRSVQHHYGPCQEEELLCIPTIYQLEQAVR